MNETKIEILPYVAQAWRRRWVALNVAWMICVLGWIAVALMPDRYQSTTRIYVDTQSLLSPLLRDMAVNVDLDQQVEIMQRTLLSRPNIESVIRSTDLDLTVATAEQKEELVRHLQSNTRVLSEGENLFSVAYTSTDPQLARDVVQALLTIFVESNLGANRRDMDQARKFIEDQIAAYEQQLRAAEERLADFKRRHVQYLPETGHAQLLERARTELARLENELIDARTRRDILLDQMREVPRFLDVNAPPRVVIAGGGRGGGEADPLAAAEAQLAELRLRFTDRHPDVIMARRLVEDLRAKGVGRRAPAPASSASAAVPGASTEQIPNPVHEEMQLRLVEIEAVVQTLQRRRADQEQEVRRLEAMAQEVPQIEAQYTALNRDYDVLKANYEKLLERRESARISQEMDAKANNVIKFRIVDPPEVPVKPVGPAKPLFASLVLVGGLAAGGFLAFLLIQQSDSFDAPHGLREAFQLPVLGSISAALTAQARRRERMAAARFAVVLMALFATYGLVMAHFTDRLGAVVARLPQGF